MNQLKLARSTYFKSAVAVVLFYLLITLIIFFAFPDKRYIIDHEHHFGENLAALSWGLGFLFCLVKFTFFFSKKEIVVQWLWMTAACFLGVTRELDMHKNVTLFGMTWKTEWLNDPATPWYLKVPMYAMMISMVGGMLGSAIWNHKKIIEELRQSNVVVTLFCLGMVFMGTGFLLDGSILGKKVFYPVIGPVLGQYVEEVTETMAAMLCFSAVIPFALSKTKEQRVA